MWSLSSDCTTVLYLLWMAYEARGVSRELWRVGEVGWEERAGEWDSVE